MSGGTEKEMANYYDVYGLGRSVGHGGMTNRDPCLYGLCL